MHQNDKQILAIVIIVLVIAALCAKRRWTPSSTAFGTAYWATEKFLQAVGMLGEYGQALAIDMPERLSPDRVL